MDKRNLKTILRDNRIHEEYNALILRGGNLRPPYLVSSFMNP